MYNKNIKPWRPWRERESDRGERVTGEKEKKLQTQKNSWNFILSCFKPVTINFYTKICFKMKRLKNRKLPIKILLLFDLSCFCNYADNYLLYINIDCIILQQLYNI